MESTAISWDTGSFQFDAAIQETAAAINSLAWSHDGSQLVASFDDESVLIITLDTSQKSWQSRGLFSRKHGAEQTRWLGKSNHLTLAISKFQKDVTSSARVWDIRENRYLKIIPCPSKLLRGNGLSVHPGGGGPAGSNHEYFLVCCLDGSVSLHSSQDEKPIATFTCNLPQPDLSGSVWHRQFSPVASFETDTESYTFAIVTEPHVIRFLDLRHISHGEFLVFSLRKHLSSTDWIRSVDFTPLTHNLLITTCRGRMLLVSSVDGVLITEYQPPAWTKTGSLLANKTSRPKDRDSPTTLEFYTLGFGFPAVPTDESVVVCGLWDCDLLKGRVCVWNFDSGREIGSFGQFYDTPNFVKFHPQRAQLVVGDVMLTSWVLGDAKRQS
eukprot:Gregarina_sp_Poly_1__7606@NODE_426_length_8588_cov_216_941204_g347_i0_p3_GENE_NODE_426_length_8588_cov_216_941204_g347_i0NODE_426_length_8588_cov_216_941204_g347_i0_p3_ORF_typecomplete_len383_score50_74ANAPC4_WD40/PF12894_7/0_00016ANAPC4_WD40/PF12894_7/2_5e02ANAPC4_WD40/PF12894_7/4_1ANAPC4_WD40/PF12894_7/33ANAPC4_WD40/PF12894_7/58eIF2A/PF08662_11/0_16eIF2A/PF08662_11/1_4e02eIF2A/PF08662_11/34TFIIIC_delta/PF12657_7/0_13TFIIIC_delta/PF12657_7/1_4e04WD40/PF00400_32/0_041WD40/PF00400_32/6_1e03WD40/P